MKHKTDELEGALLDAAVAVALGNKYVGIGPGGCWAGVNHQDQDGGFFAPSTRWEHGGPLIEREGITTLLWNGRWNAAVMGDGYLLFDPEVGVPDGLGPTPLIAAMRAFVKSRLGEEVELP